MTFHTPMPLRFVAPGGPVSRALAVMVAADPELQCIRVLRRQIAMRIEADIALLDALAGDPDLEPGGDDEPSLGSLNGTAHYNEMPQIRWSEGGSDDREHEDEREADHRDLPALPDWPGYGVDELFVGRRA